MADLFHDILNYLKDYPADKKVEISSFVIPYLTQDDTENTIIILKTLDTLQSKKYINAELRTDGTTSTIPADKEGQKYIEQNKITSGQHHTWASITNDGIHYLLQLNRDKRQDDLLEKQTIISEASGQSVIDTNEFSKKIATRNLRILWVTLVVAIVGALATVKGCQTSIQETKRLKLKDQKDSSIQLLQKKLTEKDVVLSAQKKTIDSLLQTIDSTKRQITTRFY